MTRVYLIRHAEAMGNAANFFQGRIDTDITERGERQLELLSERMKELAFDALYSSPLKRAVKTADAANKYYGLPLCLCDGIMEIDGGIWEGMTISEIERQYPELTDIFDHRMQDFCAIGGESIKDVTERMCSSINEIVSQNIGKTVCIVSHGIVIRSYICFLMYGSLERLSDMEWCDNTSICEIEFSDGKVNVVRFADNSHLDSLKR